MPLSVALRFAYDGARFDSYARQPGRRTVEVALVAALEKEGLVAGSFRAGSRTDAGVSACENVCAAELRRPHLRGLVPALQSRLPPGLWATGAAAVPDGWNPRHAAWRRYALFHPRGGEDLARMRAACAAFVGTHDVRAFARAEAGRDPRRTIVSFTVAPAPGEPRLWRFRVRGKSFLWGQVRRMVGAALAVGAGHAEVVDVEASLASRKPHHRFGAAPAHGLVLERVHYPGLRWSAEAGSVGHATAGELASARARLGVMRAIARLRL